MQFLFTISQRIAVRKKPDYWKFKICQEEDGENKRNKVQTDAPLKYN